MRFVVLGLISLLASPLHAEDAAKAFFQQCIGPAFETQSRAQYDALQCHERQSCAPYDPLQFGDVIDSHCFFTAIDVCIVFDNADACVNELVGMLAQRSQAIRDAFPEERIRAAIAQADGFGKRGLERILGEDQPSSIPPCVDERIGAQFRAIGVSENTLCSVSAVSIQNYTAHAIQRRTIAIETADEQ